MKKSLLFVLALTACAASTPDPEPTTAAGDVYEVVNRSGCAARIVLYGVNGNVIENQKYDDIKPGRMERYILPHSGMRLEAVAVDALGRECTASESKRIEVKKVEP